MITYWLLGERPAIDLIPDALDSSEATVSNDAASITNVSLTTTTLVAPISSSTSATSGTPNPATSTTNNANTTTALCKSPDNNCSKDRQGVCFDKDIPNSIIIDSANKRSSISKEHQQESNNISNSASEGFIEA